MGDKLGAKSYQKIDRFSYLYGSIMGGFHGKLSADPDDIYYWRIVGKEVLEFVKVEISQYVDELYTEVEAQNRKEQSL